MTPNILQRGACEMITWDESPWCEHGVSPCIVHEAQDVRDAVMVWLVVVTAADSLRVALLPTPRRPWANAPGWFEESRTEAGLVDLLTAGRTDLGIRDLPLLDVLARHGIAPGQPFRVRLYEQVYRSGGYYEPCEGDFQYWDPDVLEILPWPAERVLASWERCARRLAVWRAKEEARGRAQGKAA